MGNVPSQRQSSTSGQGTTDVMGPYRPSIKPRVDVTVSIVIFVQFLLCLAIGSRFMMPTFIA